MRFVVLQKRGWIVLFGGFLVFLSVMSFGIGRRVALNEVPLNTVVVVISFSALLSLLLIMGLVSRMSAKRLESRQNWLIDVMNRNFQRLDSKMLNISKNTNTQVDNAVAGGGPWPWGHHHTEHLGHLEAAAKKWWVLYDPSDSTTAPLNEMVSEWLQLERKVSRTRAESIASMLRPDGLPTGPRKNS